MLCCSALDLALAPTLALARSSLLLSCFALDLLHTRRAPRRVSGAINAAPNAMNVAMNVMNAAMHATMHAEIVAVFPKCFVVAYR